MFGRNTKAQIDLRHIQPSSKMTLKMSCLAACENNIEEAQKLYDFIASDINLPDTDIMPPTAFEKVKSSAEGIFSWVNEHRDDIMQGWNIIQMMRGNAPVEAATSAISANVPPLPK